VRYDHFQAYLKDGWRVHSIMDQLTGLEALRSCSSCWSNHNPIPNHCGSEGPATPYGLTARSSRAERADRTATPLRSGWTDDAGRRCTYNHRLAS
jgi:hypothetical protein